MTNIKIECDDCPHEAKCSEGYPRSNDGDDYTAKIGTHLCAKSWHDFKCCDGETYGEKVQRRLHGKR